MKLKKLLAAVTAAALAVTTMAVTSFTANAAAKDPVEITLYDSSTAPAGEDCGSGGKIYTVSASQLSSWGVTEENLSNCSVVVTYATAPTAGVIGINANGSDGSVDWTANFKYVDSISGSTSSIVALDSVGDKAAAVIANGLTVQVKSAYITKIDFSVASATQNIFAYTAGAVTEVEFNAEAMAALEDASGISAAITGTGNGYGYFQEMTSYKCSNGGNPATLTSEDENWNAFASASGIKLIMNDFTAVSKVVLTVTYPAATEPSYNLTPSNKEIEIGDYQIFTLEGYDGQEQPTWEIDETYVDVITTGVDVDNNQCKLIGKAATDPTTTLTVTLNGKIVGTAVITIVEGDTPPAPAIPEGTKVTLNDNPPYNWQNVNNVTIPGITNWTTTVAEAKEKLDSVTFTFNVNGALSNGTEFDISKLGFQGVIQTNDTEGLWKTYDATVSGSKVTITMTDIGAAFGDKTGAVNFAVAINTAYDNAEDPVDVYISEIKVDVKAPDEGGDEPDPPTPPATGDKTFEGEATIICDNYWGQTTVTLEQLIGDLDPEKTTVVFTGEFIKQIGYNSVSQTPTADGSKWREIVAANGKITLDASDLVTDGFYFVIAAGKESGDATISWVATEKGNKPDEPDQPDQPDPPTPPVTTDAIWEGTQDFGNWADTPVEIEAEKFSSVNANDTIKFTYSINAVPGEAWNQIKIADGNDTVLASPTGKNEWGCVDLSSATTYSFEISAADLALVKANGMKLTGHGVVLAKVEKVSGGGNPPVDPGHTHTPATAWTSDATGHWHACTCDEKFDFAAHTFNAGTITTPATETTAGVKTYTCTVCSYSKTETIPATGVTPSPAPGTPSHNYTGGVVVPVINNGSNSKTPSISGDNGKSGWDAIISEIAASGDGAKVVVDMNGATKVPSSIMREIEGLDIDLVLNMGRGTKWTINGLSVTGHKNIDFGVSKNTRHIPGEVVSTVDGTYKRQISLDHNGTFGCTAALTVDVGTKYNGLYANLFYYNPKTESLELTDCSLISGGNAKFMFTHASDYLITVTAEPLGEFEDVSSAAGIASDNNSIGNGIAVSAVLAAIVLSFGIVVYRKRRHN